MAQREPKTAEELQALVEAAVQKDPDFADLKVQFTVRQLERQHESDPSWEVCTWALQGRPYDWPRDSRGELDLDFVPNGRDLAAFRRAVADAQMRFDLKS